MMFKNRPSRTKLAAKLKLNAPFAHTWLEIVGARWGTAAHLVFMFFGYVNASFVCRLFYLTRKQPCDEHHSIIHAYSGRLCNCHRPHGYEYDCSTSQDVRDPNRIRCLTNIQACFLIPLGVSNFLELSNNKTDEYSGGNIRRSRRDACHTTLRLVSPLYFYHPHLDV